MRNSAEGRGPEARRRISIALSIPNFITLFRIILVPVVFWLLVSGHAGVAFVIFLVAGISDAVDGYLAKRFHWESELGAYLDPLADKLLIVSIFIALGFKGALPSWLVIAVVSRDLLIVAAVLLSWVLHNPVRIAPLMVSKANTAAQILLAAVILADLAFGLGWHSFETILIWTVAALTLASLAAYLTLWLDHMSSS